MKNIFDAIKNMFASESDIIAIANACDKAYAEGTGNPDWYSPFGSEKPEKVAQNLAALIAVNTGLSILCWNVLNCDIPAQFKGDPSESAKIILKSIVSDEIPEYDKGVFLRLANCSWNAGQPFRNIVDKPLSRVKGMNMFDLLPQEEVDKDWHQIKAAAIFLVEKLGIK